MKTLFKRLTSLLITLALIGPHAAFAQSNNALDQFLVSTDIRSGDVVSFLEEFSIIENCFQNRKNHNGALIGVGGVCAAMQVFSGEDHSLRSAWDQASRLGVIPDGVEQRDELTDLEYLSILFELAGVDISPLSFREYVISLREVGIRINRDDMRTMSIAIENGLFLAPESVPEAKLLVDALSNSLTISQGLAYLYQISTSEHETGPIITITSTPSQTSTPEASNTVKLEGVLKEVIRIIKTESLYSDKFDEQKAMEAAIKALVGTLTADQYIQFLNSKEFHTLTKDFEGELEGIGAYIEITNGKIIIVSPIKGSPAHDADLRPEDIITHIDGVSTEGMSLQEAVDRIRGQVGTEVKLTINRKGQILQFFIIRASITVPEIIRDRQDGVEIIQLVQFGNRSAQEMRTALEDVMASNAKGLIIDLRNNPGGFLDQVVNIVDYFIPKNSPVVFLDERNGRTPINASIDPIFSGIPVAVLINKGSASASEILAGALQNYGIADIYGETSFGKGTVQNIISLRDSTQRLESAFKLTTAEYLVGSKNGQSVRIDGIGVIPDSNPPGKSPLTDNRETEVDEALEAVINAMK